MKALHIVEAALFSAGGPVSIEEIAEKENITKAQAKKAVEELQKMYDDRDTVLEVRKAGTKWAMQVRTVAAEPAAKFAPMEIPVKVLKTLALIAYHQPIKQSDLKDMIGSKVYDHVGELKEHGLIKSRKDGITKILTVTAAFPEYFGLDAATPEEIRRTMAKMVGLDPDADRPRSVESFEAVEAPGDGLAEPEDATPPPMAPTGDRTTAPNDMSAEAEAKPVVVETSE